MSYHYQDAETFIKSIFYAETHDKNNTLNIPAIVKAKLVSDNQEKDPEYYGHRDGVVHVTSLSKCLRGVVYEMLGTQKDGEMDARKLGVFKAGNLFEEFIVTALGAKMLDRQTEYVYEYKSVILTGRDDGTILHDDIRTMLENKSVHSDSFWYREKEGTLIAANNQMQIQTYLWLRRILPDMYAYSKEDGAEIETIYTNLSEEKLKEYKGSGVYFKREKPDNANLNGIFCYISKDDCTIAQAPVKFNQRIIDLVVLPALDLIVEGYGHKNPLLVPIPATVVFNDSRKQYQKNWLCTYCEYHSSCASLGWILEATNLVTTRNKEYKAAHPPAKKTKKVEPPT